MRVANAEDKIRYHVDRFDMARFLNEDLLDHVGLYHFPAYTNVYIQDDEQHVLYFLVEGQVQCNHYHLDGKLAVYSLANPFAVIGDFEILTDKRVHSNVIATRDTTMLGIASSEVDHYGADDPRFLRFLIDQLRDKLYQKNVLQYGYILPLVNRLAIHLLAQPSDDNGEILLPDKEVLASLLGVTTRHLNRVLRELGESGSMSAVDYPRVRILDRQTLQDLAE